MPERAVGEPAEQADTGETPRFRADDFRLRLDSPLFHRDPGMAAAAQAPQLRELTWEHVVRPNANQQAARATEVDVDTTLDDGLAGESARPMSPVDLLPGLKPIQLSPVPSIEDLLDRSRYSGEHPVIPSESPAEDPTALESTADAASADAPSADTLSALGFAADHSGSLPRTLPSFSSFSSTTDEMPVKDPSGSIAHPGGADQYRTEAETDDEAADWAALNVLAEGKPELTPYVQPRMDSLLAALEQMDAAEAEHAAEAEQGEAPVETPITPLHEVADNARDDQRHHELLAHLDRLDSGAVEQQEAVEPAGWYADTDLDRDEPPAVDVMTSGGHAVQRPITGSQQAVPQSAVEAELNRLAFLPDQEEPVGPVEVPAIAYSAQPVPPAVAAPALSQHEMYSPRQSAPAVHSRASFVDLAANAYAPPPRKRKRHIVRNMITLLVLLALVGGGLFAAKYYLLDKRWEGPVKELAADVEQQRELTFDHAVAVTTLPASEYATKIATLALGVTADNTQAIAAEWRAFGLLSGPLDLRVIGLNAMPDSPAYYDPASETIYVIAGLDTPVNGARPALYDFAMQRALTLALLDQTFGWGARVKGASPSVANGTRALYDADALATADALTSATARTQVFAQILEMYGKYGIPTTPSPYASVVTGRLGVALVPYLQSVPPANRPAVLKDRTITDAQALDIRRLVPGGNEAATAGARGMLFWYHALAARVGTDTAWKAALAWKGDDIAITTSTTPGVACMIANITVDRASLDSVARAFQEWASSAPVGQAPMVSSADLGTDGQITISACDSADAAVVDLTGHASLGGAPLRAEQFRLLLLSAQPPLPAAQVACAVFGSDDITIADDRGVIDAVVGWQAPVNHPAPDPTRLGCAPAA